MPENLGDNIKRFEDDINTWIVNNIDKDIRVHVTSNSQTTTIVIQYNTGNRNKTDSIEMDGDVTVIKADKSITGGGV